MFPPGGGGAALQPGSQRGGIARLEIGYQLPGPTSVQTRAECDRVVVCWPKTRDFGVT